MKVVAAIRHMARIHYGLAGEGRGHAVRARTLLEELQRSHRVVVHAPGDAYDFLAPLYAGHARVEIRAVPGLRWSYDRRQQVALVRSALDSLAFLASLRHLVDGLARTLRTERADLVLTDFEPALSRAALRADVPLVAIDHQAFLTTSDFSDLPLALRGHAAFMGAFVKRWSPEPALRVVSSFYRPKLRAGLGAEVRQSGVFVRKALREASTTRAGFLLAYLRPGVPERALEVLRRAPVEVRLYGRGTGPREGSLVRRAVSESQFISDLAACDGLVSTAGNQLVGEALFLGKPVLAAPELRNREQEINAWFLDRTAGGRATTFSAFDSEQLARFLDQCGGPSSDVSREPLDGTATALAAIDEALGHCCGSARNAPYPTVRVRSQPTSPDTPRAGRRTATTQTSTA